MDTSYYITPHPASVALILQKIIPHKGISTIDASTRKPVDAQQAWTPRIMNESGRSNTSRERGGSFAATNDRTGKANDEQGDIGSSNGGERALKDGDNREQIKDISRQPLGQYLKLVHGSSNPNGAFSEDMSSQNIDLSRLPFSQGGISHITFNNATPKQTTPPKNQRQHSPEPPVTKATLSELDPPRIVLNPKLRHDVNFDPDLHFRPNLDGEKGRRKSQKAAAYWNTLRSQLLAFVADPIKFEAEYAGQEWCLPLTLRTIAEILETLVPPEDQASVREILNVDMLMQQFSKGVADLENLALWLETTLKKHCAPMRDDWVNEMVKQLCNGNRDNDVTMLAMGLQTLMGVLEAMKLDVANHQIRCLRPLLIQDTVEFEQTFFMKKISMRKVDISHAHLWYRELALLPDFTATESPRVQDDMWAFFKGFLSFLLPSKDTQKVPHTFMFDDERINKLRSDILDAVNMEVCVRLFRNLHREAYALHVRSRVTNKGHVGRNLFPERLDWAAQQSSTDPSLPLASQEATLRSAITAILDDVQSSPSTPTTSTGQFSFDFSSQPASRWSVASSHIPLQILRSIPGISENLTSLLPEFEFELYTHLKTANFPQQFSPSQLFMDCETHILSILTPILSSFVECFTPLSSAKLFKACLHPRKNSPYPAHLPDSVRAANLCPEPHVPYSPQPSTKDNSKVLEVARLIAHIGTLHWRVWAPLAYLVDPDAEEFGTRNSMSPIWNDTADHSSPQDEGYMDGEHGSPHSEQSKMELSSSIESMSQVRNRYNEDSESVNDEDLMHGIEGVTDDTDNESEMDESSG